MSETFSALCEFAATWLSAFPIGGAVGIIFGPLRLAGVDFSQYYRDPAEISERDDGSWIGLINPPPYSPAKLSSFCCFSSHSLLRSFAGCWSRFPRRPQRSSNRSIPRTGGAFKASSVSLSASSWLKPSSKACGGLGFVARRRSRRR